MNKYTELSDFEINKKVAEKLGAEWFVTTTVWDELVVMVGGKCFKPCDNPSDAMPIIIENKICTAFDVFAEENDGGNWVASPAYGFANEETRSNNLYRAAMELFLLMKDAENEKV
ncbi:phage recombination protein [Proteus vulgaris]|uniref:Phage recombination protein n=1 Tax=Proteus vulgaris TaxID=585 RepID=A0A379FDG0_PROVU|nr:phage protein NinX family protein [Proteus vulgaris]SUC17532.1 phage recombination protein [Proteus vulgaris]